MPYLYMSNESPRHRQPLTPSREYAKEYKLRKGCCICGYDKTESALCFHHRDPSQKRFVLTGTNHSWSRIFKEIAKCDVMCLNCHAELHEAEETTVSVEVDPDQMVLFK